MDTFVCVIFALYNFFNVEDSREMKTIIIIILLFFIAILAVAQEPIDTVDYARQLQEVKIEAPRVIRKADMDLYIPSKSAVDNSNNGV